MAIPATYLKKRDLMHNDRTPAAQLIAVGHEYLKADRYSDALDFFERAKDAEGMATIKKIALNMGDTFLLSRLERHDRTLVSIDDWKTAGDIAEKAGKPSMAAFAQRKIAPPEVAKVDAPALPGTASVADI